MRQEDHNKGQGPSELCKIGQPGQVSGNLSQNKKLREKRKKEGEEQRESAC